MSTGVETPPPIFFGTTPVVDSSLCDCESAGSSSWELMVMVVSTFCRLAVEQVRLEHPLPDGVVDDIPKVILRLK